MPATLMTDAARNAATDAVAALITHLSLHTATPGITGAAEATGGTPAYARKAVTFNASGAQGPLGLTLQPATVGKAWSNELTFDLPAGTYSYWGSWSAVTAGTFRVGNTVDVAGTPTPQVLASQGQVKHSVGIGATSGA